MRALEELATSIQEGGIVCLSIRPPSGKTGWIVNSRVDDNGWRCGEAKPTLQEAVDDNLRKLGLTADALHDLLG